MGPSASKNGGTCPLHTFTASRVAGHSEVVTSIAAQDYLWPAIVRPFGILIAPATRGELEIILASNRRERVSYNYTDW
jgi:hypothetical protein